MVFFTYIYIECCTLVEPPGLQHRFVLDNTLDLLHDFRGQFVEVLQGLNILQDLLGLARTDNSARKVGVLNDPGECQLTLLDPQFVGNRL